MGPLLDVEFEWYKDPAGYKLLAAVPGSTDPCDPVGTDRPPYAAWSARVGRASRISCRAATASITSNLHASRRRMTLLIFLPPTGRSQTTGIMTWPASSSEQTFVRSWMIGKVWRKPTAYRIGQQYRIWQLTASLTLDQDGAPRLKIRPSSLQAMIYLQLAQALAGDNTIRECPHCGTLFKAGRGTARRLDAKFCTPDHQRLYNSLRRSIGE